MMSFALKYTKACLDAGAKNSKFASEILGFKETTLKAMLELGFLYSDTREFIRDYDELSASYDGEPISFEQAASILTEIKVPDEIKEDPDQNSWMTIKRTVHRWLVQSEHSSDPHEKEAAMMLISKLKRWVLENIHYEPAFNEESYFAYADCCSCGEMAPPEGNIILQTKNGLRYSLCKDCHGDKLEPDWKKVAMLHYVAASETNIALDTLLSKSLSGHV